ncbi:MULTISPECIES: thiamine pyrophosphate-binding protein [unclassified Sinorhizobium]|uniref:thiamine pyrophosphate-binding protein n=1 Tax=unclassified Sinorhizobium TaxID=2613772 RepID=UPI0035255A9C
MNSISTISSNPLAYRALAAAFHAEGTEVLFTLLGDGNMHWAASLTELGVRGIYARHEHAACAMATMYARATRKVGVASVTCGPGLTQIMTALTTAAQARIPLVVFAGESPMHAGFYNQHVDQRPLVVATGAHYITAHSLQRMTDYVREAFFLARTERMPVVLGVPLDLQKQMLPKPYSYEPSSSVIPHYGRMSANRADVDRAVEAIEQSKKIVLVAGLGALHSQAQADCEALADACGGMLATTLPARGMFDHHPFGIGISGGYARATGRRLMQEADLLIAVGASLAHFTADGGKLYRCARTIQIDTQPLGLKHGRKAADIYVRADAREGVRAILERLSKDQPERSWRSDALAEEIAQAPADDTSFPPQPGVIDPREAVAAIDRVVPKDWEVINSSGHCAYFTAQLRGRKPENFNVIREFGAIGNGLSYAMGAAAGKPERTIVLLDGDGSLLMHAQELETVRRHGLKLLICVLNDGAYGSEIHKMHSDGISAEGATFGRGDLAAVARGFGLRGRMINGVDQFGPAFEEFLNAGPGAELWDIHIADNVTTPVMRAHMSH